MITVQQCSRALAQLSRTQRRNDWAARSGDPFEDEAV
jgi:hypothetical protein